MARWMDACIHGWMGGLMCGCIVGQSQAQTSSARFGKRVRVMAHGSCSQWFPSCLMASFAKQEARSGAFLETSQSSGKPWDEVWSRRIGENVSFEGLRGYRINEDCSQSSAGPNKKSALGGCKITGSRKFAWLGLQEALDRRKQHFLSAYNGQRSCSKFLFWRAVGK